MNGKKVLNVLSLILIGLSAFGILMVSVKAFVDPQEVMDMVHVKLTNNDAYSSIRGVYGGVGMTIFISFIYLGIKNVKQGLAFAAMLWGFYAFSRIITIMVEGRLGDFGQQWLVTESFLCIVSLVVLFFRLKTEDK